MIITQITFDQLIELVKDHTIDIENHLWIRNQSMSIIKYTGLMNKPDLFELVDKLIYLGTDTDTPLPLKTWMIKHYGYYVDQPILSGKNYEKGFKDGVEKGTKNIEKHIKEILSHPEDSEFHKMYKVREYFGELTEEEKKC